jgi:copper chaperone CopZ
MKTIYVPDIECESCVKLIRKSLDNNGVSNYEINNERILLKDDTNSEFVTNLVKSLGYRASTSPFERMTFKERIRHFKENKNLYQIELLGLKYGLTVSIVLLFLVTLFYFIIFRHIEDFLVNYGWWIFYLLITVVSVGIATWHYTAYRTKITCMMGMMIGMTFGMQTGMMLGAVVGATNGFFWGSMVGMLTGTFIGIQTGKCCGIMGILEGAMAGLMGGTMGPMISVMMFSDNLLFFMPFYMLINVLILLGFSYMLYEEAIEGKKFTVAPLDQFTFISLSIIVTTLIVILMVYGPSSALISY